MWAYLSGLIGMAAVFSGMGAIAYVSGRPEMLTNPGGIAILIGGWLSVPIFVGLICWVDALLTENYRRGRPRS